MKKLMIKGFATLLVGMAAGCASVTCSSPDSLNRVTLKGASGVPGRQMVLIDTSGFYILWTIPLVSGDLRWNDRKNSIEGGFSLFNDQVGINELQNALLKLAESRKCDLADVSFFDGDASYAGPSYGGAVGTLFGSSHMSVSAVLIPRPQAK